MKFVSIVTAAALALTPAMASAGSHGDNPESTEYSRPISGPTAGRDGYISGAIGYEAFLFGGGALAFLILCVLACSSDSNVDSEGGTTSE